MVFKIDFIGGTVLKWSEGGRIEKDRDYNPSIFLSSNSSISEAQKLVEIESCVVNTSKERWKTLWRREEEEVLRIDVRDIREVKALGRKIRTFTEPGKYRLYNMDFTPQFRYCIENRVTPESENLEKLNLEIPRKQISDQRVSRLSIDGETFSLGERGNLEVLMNHLDSSDPDILVLNSSKIVPLVCSRAEELGIEGFSLGRASGFTKLAGGSNFTSYGVRSYSPARYNVPGRALVDLSNSFFMSNTGIHGVLDLVDKSWKPVQEASWASIGNILTAIQIRHALEEGVLVPWKSWRAEIPKKMSKLHSSDRGGFIFSPETGVHEDVYECDFSSLYPNIICTRNVSPDVIRCSCHDSDDVPGLGYSICEEEGYLKNVLQPLIDERDRLKKRLRETNNPEKAKELESRSDALKWILVSCFGYQGFNNAKFGRIECHESINAFAREILLDTKEEFEKNGWSVVHGIIDSIWVKPGENAKDVEKVCRDISEKVGIELEFEGRYDWIAFCPKKNGSGGALNRYFGMKETGFKFRGIELRQKSTPEFVKSCQKEMVNCFDRTRNPEKVLELVKKQVSDVRKMIVPPEKLLISKKVSKKPGSYKQDLKSVSAVRRASKLFSVDFKPGESVDFLVVDDSKKGLERVRVGGLEDLKSYDPGFYEEMVLRACESVLRPLGYSIDMVRESISEIRDVGISVYTD